MLVIAWRAPSALRVRVVQLALEEGCGAVALPDPRSWLGIAAPCMLQTTATELVAAWPDGSIEATIDGERCLLRSAAPAQRALYVHDLGAGAFVASSSLPLLVRLLQPALSVRGLAACLLVLGLPDRAPYVGIRRVASLPDACRLHQIDDLEPATRALEAAIGAAVERATHGAQKVAVLLSGGLDSSAVLAALIEQKQADDIVPITWDLGAAGGDEPHLAAWEARLGRRVERVGVGEAAALFSSSLVLGAAPTALMTGAFERAAMQRAK
ncbi:MAG: hypothetical protein EOP08_02065, partial [Proteobacteria bacterium]